MVAHLKFLVFLLFLRFSSSIHTVLPSVLLLSSLSRGCLFRLKIWSVVLLAQTQKYFTQTCSWFFFSFCLCFCLRYFENFHSHWSLPVIAAFFVGIFCSSKKLRQTKRSGGVLFAAHTLLLLHHGVHLACSGGGWVPHFHQQHVSRARGKNVVFFVFLFYLFFFSVFTTARIFASSSL